MFDLTIFANPARLKRGFLNTSEVAPQSMGAELQLEFDKISDEHANVLVTGHFWRDFYLTFRNHILQLVLGRAVMTL